MNRFLCLAATVLVAGVASTSGAQAQFSDADWSGAYAGTAFGSADDADYRRLAGGLASGAGNLDDLLLQGGFAGYNWQRGNLVYGAELAMSNSGLSAACADCQFGGTSDLRGRFGYAIGHVLIHSSLGVMSGSATVYSNGYDLDGITFGIGADWRLSERAFLSVELMHRTINGSADAQPAPSLQSDLQSVSLHAGFRF